MLDTLPPEILAQVVTHIPIAHDVRSLALTCRLLYAFIRKDGWRTFIHQRFPSIPVPFPPSKDDSSQSDWWQDAAHALTTLSRNFDRRAIIATELRLRHRVLSLPTGTIQDRWDPPKGQTMGYQAMVHSHETWLDSRWSSRREVVAWGAGAEVIVRIQTRNADLARQFDTWHESQASRQLLFDHGRARYDWITFKEPGQREGRDDITTVRLLPDAPADSQKSSSPAQHVVLGRASGQLDQVSLTHGSSDCITRRFDTSNTAVRSIDLNRDSSSPLLAAALGDESLALYPLNGPGPMVAKVSSARCVSMSEVACRTWSTMFLTKTRLAVSRGPSKNIVHVYEIAHDGLRETPLRTFQARRNHRGTTSAYPIATMTATSGQALWSGGYDGKIRLHDMRSPADSVASLFDPIDDTAVFSLETLGFERVIAGSSMNSVVKIFDLRMSGGRAYSYLDVSALLSQPQNDRFTGDDNAKSIHASGFNIFTMTGSGDRHSRNRHSTQSPVYSLSRPSELSTSLYVGLEKTVVHFNFTSAFDKTPDPLFRHGIRRKSARKGRRPAFDPQTTWFSSPEDVIALRMYEQKGPRNMIIMHQRLPQKSGSDQSLGTVPGHDERLYDRSAGVEPTPYRTSALR